jgi:hypothetical protein
VLQEKIRRDYKTLDANRASKTGSCIEPYIETPDKSDRLCGEAAFKPLH